MAKNRNGMLGVGGQRKTLSRRELRGGAARTSGNAQDPAAQKRELLAKMRERNEQRTAGEADENNE